MMRSDKETKKWFKSQASAHPDNFYATGVLKREGFTRKQCACKTWYWTVNESQDHCGDPACSGGFKLFDENPAKNMMTYIEVWQKFADMLGQRGYKVMPRYPVVARWNPTMDFTIASIAAFQPHVVSGEAEPPAEKLVIPQFCLRFGDIDNVGITGSHMTGFIMIGQHSFVPPERWDQATAFQDLYDWFTVGLGLPKHELTMHEDAWAGGGNYGPCMEFFSRGVELGNQVYMLYEQTPNGDRELSLKVLDMGMGMERNAWFSQGKGTMYDATFPLVIQMILDKTGHTPDIDLQKKFLPNAAYLNIDEVDDVQEAWANVALKVGVGVEELRKGIEPLQAIYSIAEHARALLFALTDGALPSNVGGGYNLRTIFRRAQSFIDKFSWKLDMGEVAEWHARELEAIFPELLDSIEQTKKILSVEKKKYIENKNRAKAIIEREVKKGEITTNRLIELYDSDGINPEDVEKYAKEHGVKIDVPDKFYQMVSERHEKSEQKTATKRELHFDIDDVPKTGLLYFDTYDLIEFDSVVVKVLDEKHVILEKTAFYPTSGGQEHDTGVLTVNDTDYTVIDVIKQGGVVIHVLGEEIDFSPEDKVHGKIDWERRKQLAQHHTATHIINGAAKKVLGNHVWQAGAAKTTEKGRIDITHYENLAEKQIVEIEEEANKIVEADITLKHGIVPKGRAEAEHGFRLYQGGAVPGKEIRVVDIPGYDTEACGGTHLNRTGEVGKIKILKSSKIQDGIVRLEYVAGAKSEQMSESEGALSEEIQKLLGVSPEYFPSAADALFRKWKKAKKGKLDSWVEPELKPYKGDFIAKTAEVLKTQQENIVKTIKRFQGDIDGK